MIMNHLLRIIAISLLVPTLVQGLCDCEFDTDCYCISTHLYVGLGTVLSVVLLCAIICLRCWRLGLLSKYLASTRTPSTVIVQSRSNVPYSAMPDSTTSEGHPPPYRHAQVHTPSQKANHPKSVGV